MGRRKRLSLKATIKYASDSEIEDSGGVAGTGAEGGGVFITGVVLRTIWYLIRGVPEEKPKQ